jgi:hypothetical protein
MLETHDVVVDLEPYKMQMISGTSSYGHEMSALAARLVDEDGPRRVAVL